MPGTARRYSKANVTELALVGALVSVGCKPSAAAMWAETLIEEKRARILKPPRYLVCPAQGFDQGSIVTRLDECDLPGLLASNSHLALVIVDVGAIFDRVDRLFADYHAEGAE